ncbi:MAG: Kae1-associated serine/threonine protein kinase, partial [Candidatus Diapherotrites archaeon]|nr:Kae1-associated serine/threonine protein kinase [Candidatus Diapherotrites archaeon]
IKWIEFNEHKWETVGQEIKKLHSKDIIHGDLSTSNIFFTDNKKIAFIDFGLGFISKETEDKAVDLLVLKKTLSSTHSRDFPKNWNAVTKGYDNKQVLDKITEIEKRARYT